jgi:hypothetical protein
MKVTGILATLFAAATVYGAAVPEVERLEARDLEVRSFLPIPRR